MNIEYILDQVKRKGAITLDLRQIKELSDFKTGEDEISTESLLLVLGGHSPIRNFNFDIEK